MIPPSPGRTGAKPDRLPIIIILHHSSLWARRLSDAAKSTRADLGGANAYQILGVAETSSFAEIKASFRKLAKQTHPDLVGPTTDPSRFVSILTAYEILSDSTKRAHYDEYLFSQRIVMENRVGSARGSTLYMYRSWESAGEPMEVVEWLRWYRVAVSDLVSEKRVVVGTGYFDVLESDFYSALHMAYYGPDIGLLDLLPDCFEAEERSVCETPEVLHLVSGRDLFGMVCLVDRLEEISAPCLGRLDFCSKSSSLEASQSCADRIISSSSDVNDEGTPIIHDAYGRNGMEDAYKDLKLHVSGRVIALATRIHPKGRKDGLEKEDDLDQISVYLCPEGYSPQSSSKNDSSDGTVRSRIPLGTITGSGTSSDEGSCFVYDSSGTKTHVIMKHRTLLVKHLHWYGVGDRVSVCECRCSRARLPPSKIWLFEPRCGMHDIGGWYVETFGRDKKGRTVPSQRHWDGLDRSHQFDNIVRLLMPDKTCPCNKLVCHQQLERHSQLNHHQSSPPSAIGATLPSCIVQRLSLFYQSMVSESKPMQIEDMTAYICHT